MKEAEKLKDFSIGDLKEDYINSLIRCVKRFTKELNEEMDNDASLITCEDKRFERIRALVNDSNKTIEMLGAIDKSLTGGEEGKHITTRNGKRIRTADTEKVHI